MKPLPHHLFRQNLKAFSALGRAVWDETQALEPRGQVAVESFQCSRSSRMG